MAAWWLVGINSKINHLNILPCTQTIIMASIYISWDTPKESGLMIQKQKTGTENSELMIQKQKTENRKLP